MLRQWRSSDANGGHQAEPSGDATFPTKAEQLTMEIEPDGAGPPAGLGGQTASAVTGYYTTTSAAANRLLPAKTSTGNGGDPAHWTSAAANPARSLTSRAGVTPVGDNLGHGQPQDEHCGGSLRLGEETDQASVGNFHGGRGWRG